MGSIWAINLPVSVSSPQHFCLVFRHVEVCWMFLKWMQRHWTNWPSSFNSSNCIFWLLDIAIIPVNSRMESKQYFVIMIQFLMIPLRTWFAFSSSLKTNKTVVSQADCWFTGDLIIYLALVTPSPRIKNRLSYFIHAVTQSPFVRRSISE